MEKDTLVTLLAGPNTNEKPTVPTPHVQWLAVAIALTFILSIALIVIKHYHKSKKYRLKKELKKETRVDFNDVIVTAFAKEETEKLRRELLAKSHPDRFSDENTKQLAKVLYQKVNNASNSLATLKELGTEVNKLINK